MKHRGWGWLFGSLALQSIACGNARPGGDALEREVARPERAAGAVDDAPDDGSAPTATVTRIGAVETMRQRAGREGAAVHDDALVTDPDPVATPDLEPVTPDPEPDVAPDTGYEAARCAGAATRHVLVAGNLDAETMVPWFDRPFNPEDPANTAAFSTTFAGFDDQARWQVVSIYFKRVEQGWDYHALMEGTAVIIGEGHLRFDEQGVVNVEETQQLRLLTASGPGQAIALDLSGMTQLAAPCNVVWQEVDGSEARWGNACGVSETTPDEVTVAGPLCAAAATTRLTLRANLAAADPSANEPWDPLAPSSDLTLYLQANDAYGTLIDFELHLRKSSDATWDYHVLLLGEVPGNEVAAGSLSFNPNGSLHSVATTRPLRFPNRDGVLGAPIELDFGVGTAAGGSGVDGVTSLPGGSFEIWQQRDGAVLGCLARASTPPLPPWRAHSCAGERTTAVWMNFNLDPATALSDTASYSSSVTVYDAALTPQLLELNFRHLAEQRWQCQVLAASAEVGVVDLHFAANGAPELIENIPLLRLPLADGSAGPPIQLAFDAGWSLTSFASESSGWLGPNGAAPGADGCVP